MNNKMSVNTNYTTMVSKIEMHLNDKVVEHTLSALIHRFPLNADDMEIERASNGQVRLNFMLSAMDAQDLKDGLLKAMFEIEESAN